MRWLALLIGVTGCFATSAELVVLPAAPPPGPWLVLREALTRCAGAQGLAGELRVRIEIDPDGGAGSVGSSYGDVFAGCVGRTISQARYHTHRGHVIEVSFVVPS